ncbi:MAG: hypothetical protein IT447_05075 [Phycisphaerales bacterium]|jgi:DNA-binding CsgD family transcriptional regulator|nr:hypothetical protein [Phycisphaerales bacterium]
MSTEQSDLRAKHLERLVCGVHIDTPELLAEKIDYHISIIEQAGRLVGMGCALREVFADQSPVKVMRACFDIGWALNRDRAGMPIRPIQDFTYGKVLSALLELRRWCARLMERGNIVTGNPASASTTPVTKSGRKQKTAKRRSRIADGALLTDRQKQALAMHGEKQSVAEIAKAMGIKHPTVNRLLKAGQRKLGVYANKSHGHKPQSLPHDRRGQVSIAGNDGD